MTDLWAMPDGEPRLLVSVRNAAEANAAYLGGANIIDVKEPANGALGRPSAQQVDAVLREIDALQVTVPRAIETSMALGELAKLHTSSLPDVQLVARLHFVKAGLAAAPDDWRSRLADLAARVSAPLVPVAYADAKRCGAPPIADVAQWAVEHASLALLVDTGVKDGRGLFDHVTAAAVQRLVEQMHAHDVQVALAGSLRDRALRRAAALRADIVGVRGAACAQGDRDSVVNANAVAGCALAIRRTAPSL